MAAAKQQEEKRVQFLRKMVALSHNRHCFDCGQRGPTYVNMTIGSYVCTACSGILRGINPPHRVKSISMASFTQEEVDLLTQRGNEYNKQVWLGLHDTKEPPAMDTKDEIKLRDYLTQKYERKRWYQAPTDALAEAAKVMNNLTAQQQSGSSSAVRRPAGGFAGGFKIQTGTTNANTTSSLPKTIAPPAVTTASAPESHKPLSAQNSNATSAELLSDVFGSKPAQSSTVSVESEFNQPNFANFGGTQVAPPTSNPLLSATGASTTPSSQPSQWSANPPAPTVGDNKYASLTGLFSDTVEVAAPAPNPGAAAGGVNWSAINWSSGAGQPATGSAQMLSSSPAAAVSWGTSSAPVQPTAPTGNVFAAAPQATSNAGWSTGAPTTGVNPFMAAPAQPAFGAAQPQATAAFGGYQPSGTLAMAPTALSTGFGAQPATNFTAQPTQMFAAPANTQMNAGFNGYGQQPAANGQFGGVTAIANGAGSQWGAPPATNQWAPAQQWGAAGASKQPTSVNPFVAQSQAPPVQQQSMATNPFL